MRLWEFSRRKNPPSNENKRKIQGGELDTQLTLFKESLLEAPYLNPSRLFMSILAPN